MQGDPSGPGSSAMLLRWLALAIVNLDLDLGSEAEIVSSISDLIIRMSDGP